MCDLVHDVETIFTFVYCLMQKLQNVFQASLIFQKRFPDTASSNIGHVYLYSHYIVQWVNHIKQPSFN